MEKFLLNFSKFNIMCVPEIIKIVLNIRFSSNVDNKSYLGACFDDIYVIALQKPLVVYSKNSISNFNLKKKSPIALKVTLRKNNMYEFLGKLLVIVLPKDAKFFGFNMNSFDYFGNFSFGVSNNNLFSDLCCMHRKLVFSGLDITFVFKNSNSYYSYKLLTFFGFPFIN